MIVPGCFFSIYNAIPGLACKLHDGTIYYDDEETYTNDCYWVAPVIPSENPCDLYNASITYNGTRSYRDDCDWTAPVPCDPYWDQVVLTMHMDDSLVEESGTLTVSGSSYSYSTGEYGKAVQLGDSIVNTNASADLRLTGSFTIEFYLKQDSLSPSASGYFMNLTSTPGTGLGTFYFVTNSGGHAGQLNFSVHSGALQIGFIPDTMNYHHIAVVFDGSTYQGYMDGVKNVNSSSGDALIFPADPLLHIGKSLYIGGGSLYIHIDDLRITKGVARYTSDFPGNLPTKAFATALCIVEEPLADPCDIYNGSIMHNGTRTYRDNCDWTAPVVPEPVPCDPYWDNVVLAMHMDGNATDVSPIGATFTRSGGSFVSAPSGFSDEYQTGNETDNTGSNRIYRNSESAAYDLAGGDFTIQCFVTPYGNMLSGASASQVFISR